MTEVPKRLSRAELYEMVWMRPATKIGEEFRVSGVAVAKACRKLNVPRPPRGYWAKLEHGKRVVKPALPPSKDGEPDTVNLGDFAERKRKADAVREELAKSRPCEAEAETLEKTHPVVRDTKRAFVGAATSHDYGTLVPNRAHPRFSISVTKEHLPRALELLNRIAWHLERNGFEFRAPPSGTEHFQLVFRETGTAIDAAIRENTERYERELTDEEKSRSWMINRWKYRSTGRLRFLLNEYYPQGSRKSWGDGKTQRLDDEVLDIVEGCIVCARGKYAQEQEWQAQRRRWDEAERQRKERELKATQEKQRRDALLAAAVDWCEADRVRRFVIACEERLVSGGLDDKAQNWLVWARQVASELDPLGRCYLQQAIAELPHHEPKKVASAQPGEA